MQTARSERGFLSFSAMVELSAVAVVFFLALKLLPSYVGNFQLQDAVENLAQRASYSEITEREIRDAVISRAGDFGVELHGRQIAVRKRGNTVDIAIQYEVQVDLIWRRVELRFEPSAGDADRALSTRR